MTGPYGPFGYWASSQPREFSERPFAVGTLVGMRLFGLNTEGWLTGMVYTKFVWRSGVNQAECLATQKEGHELVTISCRCGFYAYYNGPLSEYGSRPLLAGIVEGWGKCVIGARGFRAEKAVIRAFVQPTELERELSKHFGDILERYPGVPVFDTRGAAAAAFPLTDQAQAEAEED